MLRTFAVALFTLVLGLLLFTNPATAQQVVTPQTSAASVTYGSSAGVTRYNLNLSYPARSAFDAVFQIGSASGAGSNVTSFGLGARYRFSMEMISEGPQINPYLLGQYVSATGSSGFFLGGGASLDINDRLLGYTTLGIMSASGASVTRYDLGLQINFQQVADRQVAFVLGYSGSTTAGAGSNIYFGVGMGF